MNTGECLPLQLQEVLKVYFCQAELMHSVYAYFGPMAHSSQKPRKACSFVS